MATGTMDWMRARNSWYDAIVKELRTWADLPRRIFMQAHYSGKSIEEIAFQSGCDAEQVKEILRTHELKLRKALRSLRAEASGRRFPFS
jgi:DNA-directed RNA polymerase specialized sigma24 family protein